MSTKPENKKTVKWMRENLMSCDMVSKNRKGNFVVRRSYYYTHGFTEEKLAEMIKQRFPDANIIKTWNQWKAFKGGASIQNQSHFGVEFNFETI